MPSLTPKVSVLIPTYNRADLLRLTLESVIAQTYPNLEVIVIDDGSTDDTSQVIESFGEKIRCIQQVNQGPDAAVANAFTLSTGEYINFMDHDDLMMPTKIERQVDILNNDHSVGLVHCGYDHIDENGKLLQKAFALPETDVLSNLIGGNFIWSGAPLIRRTCLNDVGLFDESIWCSDWDLWLRIAVAGYGFHCVQEPLGAYRILSYSVMSNTQELEKGMFATLDKVFNDKRLPVALRHTKESVYSRMHFEMSARYFMSQEWGAAGNSLTHFFDMNPTAANDPDLLWTYFWENIVKNPRLTNPVSTMESIFDHLPDTTKQVRSYRNRFIAHAYLVQAFRFFSASNIMTAQQNIEAAIQLYPEILKDPGIFVQLLTSQAYNQPDMTPFEYADRVLNNLPSNSLKLESTRTWIHGDLHVIAAFQAYGSGKHQLVPSHVLRGLRQRPGWLKNKGVLAIFLKSLKNTITAG